MTKELNQKLINTWDWLNSYCISKRDDPELACGKHAICIAQIDNYNVRRIEWGLEKTKLYLQELESIMTAYALDDTIIARYNDYTYVVVMHHLHEYDEIEEICNEILSSVNEAEIGGDTPLTISIGASHCHHDPNKGYECAVSYALKALSSAQSDNMGLSISTEIA